MMILLIDSSRTLLPTLNAFPNQIRGPLPGDEKFIVAHMRGYQNYDPFSGTLSIRCRLIIGIQNRILTNTHMLIVTWITNMAGTATILAKAGSISPKIMKVAWASCPLAFLHPSFRPSFQLDNAPWRRTNEKTFL